MNEVSSLNFQTEYADSIQTLADRLRSDNLAGLYNALAHELKSPLNSMSMNLEMLKYILANPVNNPSDKAHYYADVISRNIMLLDQQISFFFRQFTSSRTELISLEKLLNDIEQVASIRAQNQRIRLQAQPAELSLTLQQYVAEWRQAILCLVINALKRMPANDELIIQLKSADKNVKIIIYYSGSDSLQSDSPSLQWAQDLTEKCGGNLKKYKKENQIFQELVIPINES